MRTLFVMLFFLSVVTSYSQKIVDVDKADYKISSTLFYSVGGVPVSGAKYVRVVKGSPYFNESYMRGKVIMNGGSVYDSVLLRLDLVDQSLQYISKDGIEMTAVPATVKMIVLSDSLTGKKYEFEQSVFLQATNSIPGGWYQLLSDGRAALYKRIIKIITENKPYGSATTEQMITNAAEYYIFYNAVFTRIKKLKEIPALLNEKEAELNKHISSKNISGRSDADYINLVDYYNSLP